MIFIEFFYKLPSKATEILDFFALLSVGILEYLKNNHFAVKVAISSESYYKMKEIFTVFRYVSLFFFVRTPLKFSQNIENFLRSLIISKKVHYKDVRNNEVLRPRPRKFGRI